MSTDRYHHPYSPSTLQMLEVCPCWRSRVTEQVHQRTEAGTRAHKMAETGQDDSQVSDDDAAAVAECLDFVERRRQILQEEAERVRQAAVVEVDGKKMIPPAEGYQVTELKEAYLPIDDLVFPDCKSTTAGWSDHILLNYNQTYAEIIDWKFGFWPVEKADNNLQCIAYVLGLFKRFPSLITVRFFFKQPHLDYVTDATFTRAQVDELYLRVQVVVARAREARTKGDFQLANPVVPACNFCNELGRCPKVCAFACRVGKKFAPLEFPESLDVTVGTDPKQTTLALRLSQVVKIWAESFRRQLTDRILRGDAPLPPGQKIQKLEKRELLDTAKLKTVALSYMTQAEYESTLETTFGALEKIISDSSPRGQKEKTVLEFQKALLDAGAVRKQAPIAFLRAVAVKDQ